MPKYIKSKKTRKTNRKAIKKHSNLSTPAKSPGGKAKKKKAAIRDRQDRRVDGLNGKVCPEPLSEVENYISTYIVLPSERITVVSTWVIAAWLAEKWDRFPHLVINSPQKRCGKTRTLQLLEQITPRAYNTANITPAAMYRLIEARKPTLLIDEAQSITRRGSESSEMIRELLNAGIDRKAKSIRCGGANWDDIEEFSLYCPKVISLIGELDTVLADRCLEIPLSRKTDEEVVERVRSRVIEKQGQKINKTLEAWTKKNAKKLVQCYDKLEPFGIDNDRIAELLLPLQAVLQVMGAHEQLTTLGEYAKGVDSAANEKVPDDIVLLQACHDIFKGEQFVFTSDLIKSLCKREEEPWARWNDGDPITPERLAVMLKPYRIKPQRDPKQKGRGYSRKSFEEAWTRYVL